MNNNLEFENEDPSPDSIEDNHPRTNYGEGYYEQPKQETIEEAALNIIPDRTTAGWIDSFGATERIGFVNGAKWQAERMYSQEEVLELLRKAHFVEQNIEEWFEQFKKK
jgi:hypothetical protein